MATHPLNNYIQDDACGIISSIFSLRLTYVGDTYIRLESKQASRGPSTPSNPRRPHPLLDFHRRLGRKLDAARHQQQWYPQRQHAVGCRQNDSRHYNMDNQWILWWKTSSRPIESGLDYILQGNRTMNHRIILGTIHYSQLILSRNAWTVCTSSSRKSNHRTLQPRQMVSHDVLQQQESTAIVISPQRKDMSKRKVCRYL